MLKIQSVSYTSLRDLLHPTSAPAITSPTTTPTMTTVHNSSWHEIPIKNPLVKHAALAYLQPMTNPSTTEEKGLLRRFEETCCGECGCVLWIFDVVLRKTKEAFWLHDDDEDKVD